MDVQFETNYSIPEEYLTAEQLAKKINMSLKFIRRHIQTGRIPGLKRFGRMVRFERRAIEKALLKESFLLS